MGERMQVAEMGGDQRRRGHATSVGAQTLVLFVFKQENARASTHLAARHHPRDKLTGGRWAKEYPKYGHESHVTTHALAPYSANVA